ncbi:MAG: hypothetical protein ACREOH_11030 [Candidatus Entotheonellia bacterium]
MSMSDPFQFRTRINPSWLAVLRVVPSRLRIHSPFPLMNLVAREKGVTAQVEDNALVLSIGPGEPPPTWPARQLDLLALVRGHGDVHEMLHAIREAPSPVQEPVRPRPAPRKQPPLSRAQKRPRVVSIPVGNALSAVGPEEVWAAIRERKGAPFTVAELEVALGQGLAPYVMIWARDGHLVKVDRAPGRQAPWRYRLLRDQPTHPPTG